MPLVLTRPEIALLQKSCDQVLCADDELERLHQRLSVITRGDEVPPYPGMAFVLDRLQVLRARMQTTRDHLASLLERAELLVDEGRRDDD